MASLAEAASRIFDKDTMDNLEAQLKSVEKTLREDESNSIAQTLIQMIDQGEINSLEDMQEFQAMVYDYEAAKEAERVMEGGMTYDFNPPKDLLDEFGLDPSPQGKTVIHEKGQAYEVRFSGPDLEKVGPVDDEGNPMPGHPGYDNSSSGDRSSDEISGVFDSENILNTEEILQSLSQAIQKDSGNSDSDISEIVKRASLGKPIAGGIKPPIGFPQPVIKQPKPLKTVSVYVGSIGRIDYEVVDVVYSRYCVTLVFDPLLSKPSFYPEVGLDFEFEDSSKNKLLPCKYAGVVFDYEGLKFMSFSNME